jgi:hypothetical protein
MAKIILLNNIFGLCITKHCCTGEGYVIFGKKPLNFRGASYQLKIKKNWSFVYSKFILSYKNGIIRDPGSGSVLRKNTTQDRRDQN